MGVEELLTECPVKREHCYAYLAHVVLYKTQNQFIRIVSVGI